MVSIMCKWFNLLRGVVLTMLWLARYFVLDLHRFFLKASCNKQHNSICYVNGLACYMVLFNYAMLGGTTTLRYGICTGLF